MDTVQSVSNVSLPQEEGLMATSPGLAHSALAAWLTYNLEHSKGHFYPCSSQFNHDIQTLTLMGNPLHIQASIDIVGLGLFAFKSIDKNFPISYI